MGEPTSPTSIGHTGTASTEHEKVGLLGAGALGASLGGGGAAIARHHDAAARGSSSIRGAPGEPRSNLGGLNDGASMMSGSDTTTNPGMLSGADAMIVADAFRQAMRNPDLSGRPVEEDGESPPEAKESEKALMNEELKREGRDIRTVPSARDVRVQGATPPGGSTPPKG